MIRRPAHEHARHGRDEILADVARLDDAPRVLREHVTGDSTKTVLTTD